MREDSADSRHRASHRRYSRRSPRRRSPGRFTTSEVRSIAWRRVAARPHHHSCGGLARMQVFPDSRYLSSKRALRLPDTLACSAFPHAAGRELARWIAAMRDKFCPNTAYVARSSRVVVDAAAGAGAMAIIMGRKEELFRRVEACEHRDWAVSALRSNVAAYRLEKYVGVHHCGFPDWLARSGSGGAAEGAVVYLDALQLNVEARDQRRAVAADGSDMALPWRREVSDSTAAAEWSLVDLASRVADAGSPLLVLRMPPAMDPAAFLLRCGRAVVGHELQRDAGDEALVLALALAHAAGVPTAEPSLAPASAPATTAAAAAPTTAAATAACAAAEGSDDCLTAAEASAGEPSTARAALVTATGYPTVHSRRQFQALWRHSPDMRARLMRVLSNSPLSSCPAALDRMRHFVTDMLDRSESDTDDAQVYASMSRFFHADIRQSAEYRAAEEARRVAKARAAEEAQAQHGRRQQHQQRGRRQGADAAAAAASAAAGVPVDGRAQNRIRDVRKLLPLDLRVRCLLDFGCAEGSITAQLAAAFHVPPASAHGCDVRDVRTKRGFTFTVLRSPDLPYADASVDLVTALMALHHVPEEDVRTSLRELARVMRPGAVLVIREHHCDPPDLGLFLDIMHGLYALVWDDPPEWPDFLDTYQACYRTREEWTRLIEGAGLRRMTGGPRGWMYAMGSESEDASRNPFKFYYAAYEKPMR